MALTNQQCDCVLDVFDQCVVVSQAHEQWECHERNGEKAYKAPDRQTVKKGISGALQSSVTALLGLWEVAVAAGVPSDTLDTMVQRYLPPNITILNGEVTT